MNRGQDFSKPLSPSRPSCAANFHGLPVELLAYIFTFCTEKPNNNPDPNLSFAWLPVTYHPCLSSLAHNRAQPWPTMDFHHPRIVITLDQGLHGALPNNADGL
jgi:hypothetical protein